MILSVCVQESPTVEHVCIFYLRIHEAEQEELVEPNTFASKQQHLSVEAATLSDKLGISVAQAALIFKATTQYQYFFH